MGAARWTAPVGALASLLSAMVLLAIPLAGCATPRQREKAEGGIVVAWGLYERAAYGPALAVAQRTLAQAETNLGPWHPLVGTILATLASIRLARGEADLGEAPATRAVAIHEAAFGPDDRRLYPSLLTLASVEQAVGNYGSAEDLLLRALALAERGYGSDSLPVAEVSSNLASNFLGLGDPEVAVEPMERARRIVENRLGRADLAVGQVAQGLASVLSRVGRHAEAEELFRRALWIEERERGPDHPEVAQLLQHWSELYRATDELEKAEPLSRRALEIDQHSLRPENPRLAWSLYGLGEVYRQLHRFSEAEALYLDAVSTAEGSQLPYLEWHVYGGFARLLGDTGRRTAAIYFGKRAVNLVQSVRGNLGPLRAARDVQFAYSNRAYYEQLADWLVEEGRLPEAQSVLELLKEDEFDEFIRGSANGTADRRSRLLPYSPGELEAEERYRAATAGMATLAAEVEELKHRQLAEPESFGPADQQALDSKTEQLLVGRGAFKARLLTIANSLRREGRESELARRQLHTLRALRGTLQRLGEGTVMIHYFVTETRVHAILTTQNIQVVRTTPIRREALNARISAFLRAVSSPDLRDPRPEGQALYAILLDPLRHDLEAAKARTLMVSLDGALRYIPIAALWDPREARYVAEEYSVAVYVEASRQSLERAPSPTWRIAGLGVTKGVREFSPLPAAQLELEAIVRRGGDDRDGVLEGEVFLDERFTVDQLRHVLERGFNVVHLATHFVLSPGADENSFLVTGSGDELTLGEMRTEDIGFDPLDLLTLSACETAVGGGVGGGEEIEGFASLAIDQGAAGVLATLWRVDDATTSVIMPLFYRLKVEQRLSKAAALREAQLRFIRGQVSERVRMARAVTRSMRRREPSDADGPRDYSHPYYWAPFVVYGNWL